MRAMFVVYGSVLICVSLFGCNRSQQAQAPVPAPVVANAPVCNCPQQTAAAAPAATTHRHPRHHHAWSERESSSYSESYGAESESSYSPASDSAGEYDGTPESEQTTGEAHAEADLWVDGYGRSYYASAAASDDTNPDALTAEDVRRRHAPWHAYNSDCDSAR